MTGGVLSEFKLRLSRVFLTLSSPVPSDDLFGNPDRGHKIAPGPHDVVLRLVDRVGRFVQFHACQSTGSRGTLLTPPPLHAGTSRWIRLNETIFIDIEFNREGVNLKNTKINGENKSIRPDIIIHNRKTGHEKVNLLVVECKKKGAAKDDIEKDRQKILALMGDEKYEYSFGLQVIYGRDGVKGKLFFKSGTKIIPETVILT